MHSFETFVITKKMRDEGKFSKDERDKLAQELNKLLDQDEDVTEERERIKKGDKDV